MKFTTVLFRLANTDKSSIVCIEISRVENGKITFSNHWLCNPETEFFDSFNEQQREFITYNDVRDFPTFPEIWKEIMPYFQNQVVITQNTAHVLMMLIHALDKYDIEYPDFTFYDSKDLFKKHWENILIGYDLMLFSDLIGVTYEYGFGNFCKGVAQLMLRFLNETQIDDFKEIDKKFNCIPGLVHNGQYHPYHTDAENYLKSHSYDGKTKAFDYKSIKPESDQFDIHHPYFGKHLSRTGTLESCSKPEFAQMLANVGATYDPSPKKETDFLVFGSFDPRVMKGRPTSEKFNKALKLRENGSNIEILTEKEFMELI